MDSKKDTWLEALKESEFILCNKDGEPLIQLTGKIIVFEEESTYQIRAVKNNKLVLILEFSKNGFSYIQNYSYTKDIDFADALNDGNKFQETEFKSEGTTID